MAEFPQWMGGGPVPSEQQQGLPPSPFVGKKMIHSYIPQLLVISVKIDVCHVKKPEPGKLLGSN